MSKITIIDTIMGGGKTTWAIDHINQNLNENILYISPFLDEGERIATACADYREFRMPINKGKGKLYSLNELLAGGDDIASTHELFKHLDDDSRRLIEEGHYTLILDEVLSVVEPYDIRSGDIPILQKSNCVTIDPEGYVRWNPEMHDVDSKYNEVKSLAEQGCLLYINNVMLIWRYPPDVFKLFDKVYVLTYLFDASLLNYYLQHYGIETEKKSVRKNTETGKYEICDYFVPDVSSIADKVHVYDGNLNDLRQKDNAFSATWFGLPQNTKCVRKLRNNILNYYQNIIKAKSDSILWTSFKDQLSRLKGKGYTKQFIACNCRSTNAYADRYNLVYALNIYLHPAVVHFFNQRGIKVDQDLYALSEMIQWIWRSRIRNGEDINIYIPSERMRKLLLRWLGKTDAK